MFKAPTDTITIGGQDYVITAGHYAYTQLHELLRDHPQHYVPVHNADGKPVGGRIRMNPDIYGAYFHAFHRDISAQEWQAIATGNHPKEATAAWVSCDALITEADWDEAPADANPFPGESQEPVVPA